MPRAIRRVVTGHTPNGRSTIVMDGPAPQVRQRSDRLCRMAFILIDAEPLQTST